MNKVTAPYFFITGIFGFVSMVAGVGMCAFMMMPITVGKYTFSSLWAGIAVASGGIGMVAISSYMEDL